MDRLKLPRIKEGKSYQIAKLIIIYLQIYEDCYIAERDIEVQYFDCWDFYKVSIFKWVNSGVGCGNSELRNKWWNEHQKSMENLFDIKQKNISWRTLEANRYLYPEGVYDTGENGFIDGVEYWIRKEPVLNFSI